MISVIIPTRNRSKNLLNALLSIQNQSLGLEYFETLVVDNGSEDETKAVVDKFKNRNKKNNLHYYYKKTPGLHIGRHIGCENAKYDILVFVDDDIYASPQWLENILLSFQDREVMIVGGKSLPHYQKKPPAWVEMFFKTNDYGEHCGYLSLLDLGDQYIEIDPKFVWGLNFAIRKKTLIDLGGFHPDAMPWDLRKFRGDGETGLSMKARDKGLKTVYNPLSLVYHNIPKERLTIEYFEKRAYLQGISDSYSMVRKTHIGAKSILNDHILGRMKRQFNLFCKKISDIAKQEGKNNKVDLIQNRIQNAYQEGFNYHQNEIKKDPDLLSWICRDNYMECEVI